ncbi:MAG: hypothetical protein E7557_04725 [Ruminococcaceae bacterium]|nr:hypothetical protein [Oscillospiraceae bacterium]
MKKVSSMLYCICNAYFCLFAIANGVILNLFPVFKENGLSLGFLEAGEFGWTIYSLIAVIFIAVAIFVACSYKKAKIFVPFLILPLYNFVHLYLMQVFYPKTAVVMVLYDIVTILSLVYTIIQLKKQMSVTE